MDRKSCSCCTRPADFSLAFLDSTIGVRPRGQKCTKTVPFCKSCLSTAAPFLDGMRRLAPRRARLSATHSRC